MPRRDACDHDGDHENEQARWQAVVRRDETRTGRFVYAVKTTGIYCRPSCASRKPRRANVEFFAGPKEAERAGYRPCKRCTPGGRSRAQRHAAVVAALCRHVDTCDALPSVADLARRAGWSPSHLSRRFRAVTGLTPKAYLAGHRAERVRAELQTNKTITKAMYDAGYNATARFYDDTEGMLGMTPSAYRRGGTGEVIHFAIGPTALGDVLVARTARGVCAVSLGDDPDALVRQLQDRFPAAELVGDEHDFGQWVAQIVGLIEDSGIGKGLPLAVRGTAFQRRVWAALRKIPYGRVMTYSDVARAIGAPKAVRAVASACAANPIAIAIPCHRVVRKDGTLTGYRWGIDRKRALLDRERRVQPPSARPGNN